MRVESLKFRCQQQCLVEFNFISTGKPVAQLDNTRQNCLYCWGRRIYEDTHGRVSEQEPWRPHTSQEKAWIHWVTTILCTNLFLCLKPMKIPDAKAVVEKQWEKLEKLPAWQLTKVKNKSEVIAEARTKGHTVYFASLMDLCHLKNSELEPQLQKWKGRVVLRGDIRERWFWILCSIHRARIISFTKDGSKSNGRYIKATRLCRTSRRRSICLYSGQNGRCTIFVEDPKIRMSRYLDTSTKTQMA